MGIESPGLRHLFFLVPPDGAVGAGLHQVALALGLHRIDQHDAVVALGDGAVLGLLHARRIVAVLAHPGQERHVDHWTGAALLAVDLDPFVAVLGHLFRVARKGVAHMFVMTGEYTQIAVGAVGDIDDQVPFAHLTSPTPPGPVPRWIPGIPGIPA